MRTFWTKITSRKFLTAAAGVIVGVALAFGLDENAITQVAGAVTALVSVVTFIVTEGKVDSASVGQAAQQVQNAADALDKVQEDAT